MLLRVDQRAEKPVHDDKVVTVVVAIRCVVYGVPASTHDGQQVSMQVVVDVGRPEGCGEEEQLVGEEVHGHDKEREGVGDGLQDAVEGVECEASKRRHRVLLVVLVMRGMQVPAQQQGRPEL